MKINEFIPNNMLLSESKNNDSQANNSVDFASIFQDKLSEVNDKQLNAENLTQQFIKGDDVDVHQVMLATEEAKMSLELAVQVRNKIVEAYQELNRTQM